ncbi:MbcA/ParS/Xre antitoxin family protein [Stenotrophomonas maltophilia]|uniref:MbcA/ParS/Xre antitoxin family protein n=1 Tax=Stenotrophomonas maltophilia TaxID=40324 RepID=UPI002E7835FD|nr:MbcA/ParS/Xre antitoxin family protein [Stenotrophomonas maltophilia]
MSTSFSSGDPRLVGPAVRAFTQIAKAWSLTDSEQTLILGQSVHDFTALLQGDVQVEVSFQTLQRVSYVLGIYHALHAIFPNQQQADSWLRRPNTSRLFEGRPAMALMCSGRLEDLAAVRRYLDAQALLDHFAR